MDFPIKSLSSLTDDWSVNYSVNILQELDLGLFVNNWYSSHLRAMNEPILHKDYSVDSLRAEKFFESAKIFMPFIELSDLTADTSGIRPKLQEEGGEFRDFIIQDESDKGLPGFLNLIGIESPGLTASPAVAKHVGGLVENILN